MKRGLRCAESQAKSAVSNLGWAPADKVRPNLYKRVPGSTISEKHNTPLVNYNNSKLQTYTTELRSIGTTSPSGAEVVQEGVGMKVTIRKWNAVATWRWDIPEDDVCGICQVHFDGTCPSCKYPGDDCTLLSGKCGHNFHMHCIGEWIKQDSSKGQCPMCRQKFAWTEPADVNTTTNTESEAAAA